MTQARLHSSRLKLATCCLLGAFLVTPLAQANQDETNQATSGSSPVKTIALINPNSNTESTRSMADLARLETRGVAEVVERTNRDAPPLLTTPQDMIDAAPGVVALGVEAARDNNVAAIIVSAFSDPGLEELRESVDIPVFGIGEEVFHEAARDNREFGIVTVTPDEALIDSFRQKAASLGYEQLYRGVRVTPGDPTELVQSPDKLDAALAEAVKESVEEDGAQAVIMGGGPLSASALRLQPQFDVPLVVAVKAAARAAVEAIQTAE
ncbi:aspartate/glutamate racemase family protein [Halomonas sp. BM-2019]|uniref:aspartate/glutamate racemase family protein n=1 Tax=Halomonas sp. BM-2019 TaxID=2811227 RepID=UPI001B3C1BB3|nr:MAG: aspartate/glutamate racemase family protein [Halomonas sp. BM-2019]